MDTVDRREQCYDCGDWYTTNSRGLTRGNYTCPACAKRKDEEGCGLGTHAKVPR